MQEDTCQIELDLEADIYVGAIDGGCIGVSEALFALKRSTAIKSMPLHDLFNRTYKSTDIEKLIQSTKSKELTETTK